jgi:LPS export ABC transporter protein LptC
METDSVRYLPREKRLLTDKPVTIVREGFILQGLGMEADLALEEVRILSDVVSKFQATDQLKTGGLKKVR